MSVLTITRVTVAPADTEELVRRHAALVEAVGPALADARIGRLDDTTWVAVWRWASAEDLAEARRTPPPQARSAFSLTTAQSVEDIELH